MKTFGTSHSAGKNRAKPLLQRLTAPFGVAAMVATTALATPAFGNDAATISQPDVAVQTVAYAKPTNVSFDGVIVLRDAHGPAAAWVIGHPDRMAVPISLGLDTKVAPERVETKLREDFASHGINNVKFFYEVGGPGETMIGYVADKYVSPDVYPLATARDHVEAAANGLKNNNVNVFALYR